ncbi:unnamed protein product [Cutaneotrichosporon oleaginosum]
MIHTPNPVKIVEKRRVRRRGPHSPPPDDSYPFPYPFPYFYKPTEHSATCPGCPWYHPPPGERLPSVAPKRRRLPPDTRLHPAEPEPSASPVAITRPSLDPRWYPGVFGMIASHASRGTLLRLRLVSRDTRDAADKILFSHVEVRRKCPGKDAHGLDLAVLVSPQGHRLPVLPMDYSPSAPRPRMSRAFKHIRTVDYPSNTVVLPPTITRQLVSSVKMTRRYGWNYGALAAETQVDVCPAPISKSLPEALVSMRGATKRQVMVIPWSEACVSETPYSRPRCLDLDDLTFASIQRGGECVIIFRPDSGKISESTPASSSASTPSPDDSTQPFLVPMCLMIASLNRAKYTIVGLEDLPRRLMRTTRDPAKEPCPAKRLASLHHLLVAAICTCWNVTAPGVDERTVEQVAGRIRLLTKAQYRAEVGAKQYALETFGTPLEGPAEKALVRPTECECGNAQCARTDSTGVDMQLDGDWGEIVRQVLMASAAAKS